MRKRTVFIFLLVFGAVAMAFCQEEPIYLTNPSFEDMPRHSKAPIGWADCGFPGESEPDVQPSGDFSVTKPAYHGSTYLGMVVRDNDTWEAVSQRLSRPMKKGQCYEFSLHLARSELYVSASRVSNEPANYVTPAVVRIYGGFGNCDKKYLLGETPVVTSHRWLQYNFKFEPVADYTHIVIQAFYNTPTLFPYNGNVLVDNASPIRPIPCSDNVPEEPQETVPEPPIAKAEPPAPPKPGSRTNTTPVPPVPPQVTPKVVTPTTPEPQLTATLVGVTREELTIGKTIRLDHLYFDSDSSRIRKESYKLLDDIYEFLSQNPDVIVEVGGHTNSLPPEDYCDRLSTERAKAVADYLVKKGIPRKRLQHKGYGKREPIASDKTPYGRSKNQRVEIKILDFSG
jgi:outer membrane protein OmpA-like peptidoglycan-associated protein